MYYKEHDNYSEYVKVIDKKNPSINWKEIDLYFEYVLERANIQRYKDAGNPFPWTNNQILRENSFTCNRRVDDRTTKWLLHHITNNPSLSYEEKFWKSLIFRTYNKIETAELLHLETAGYDELYDKYSYELDKYEYDPFTRAYKNIAVKYMHKDKYPEHNWKSVALLRILDLGKQYNYNIPIVCLETPEIAFNWIKDNFDGVGDFLGFQLLLDLMYIDKIPYSNNCFVVSGPGSQTGVDRIFTDKDGMSYEECIIYLTEHFEELCKKYYNKDFDYDYIKFITGDPHAYCVTDIQNTLCEFSKYRYLMEGRHLRPRKYEYKGRDINAR